MQQHGTTTCSSTVQQHAAARYNNMQQHGTTMKITRDSFWTANKISRQPLLWYKSSSSCVPEYLIFNRAFDSRSSWGFLCKETGRHRWTLPYRQPLPVPKYIPSFLSVCLGFGIILCFCSSLGVCSVLSLVCSVSCLFYLLSVLSLVCSISCLFYLLSVLSLVCSISCLFYLLSVLSLVCSISCLFYLLSVLSLVCSISCLFYLLSLSPLSSHFYFLRSVYTPAFWSLGPFSLFSV